MAIDPPDRDGRPCKRIVRRFMPVTVFAAFCNPVLHAQDDGTAPAPDGPREEVQRVTVTGTNIRRIDAETPSPVQVITAEDIQRSGYTTLADVLQSITANGQGTLTHGFYAAFATGAEAVSLRGLNTDATLVLIDGHRTAPYPLGDDGQRSFVDISNLPFDAVERIEVLKDGASAIYGSDAIAGVVNIILRRSYSGASASAGAGTSYRGDGSSRHASAIWGIGDLAKDGRNFYLAVEARSQDEIRYVDRGGMFEHFDYRSQGGLDTTPGVPNEANGGLADSRTGYVTDPSGRPYFLPGCDPGAYATGKCSFIDTWTQIQPNTANANVVSRFTFDPSPTWQVSLEGTLFWSKAQAVYGPAGTRPQGRQGVTSGPGVTPTLLDVVVTTLPRSNPTFPKDAPLESAPFYYTFVDLGPAKSDTLAKTTRLTASVRGTLAGWEMDGALGHSQVDLSVRDFNRVEQGLLNEALADPVHPYLPGRPNSPAQNARIAPELFTDDVSRLDFVHVAGSHDLMPLRGGPLSIALGVDAFHRMQYARASTQIEQGLVGGVDSYIIGYQDVRSIYGELVAPFGRAFEAELQARYDHYNLSGGRTSPKLGFKWTPADAFALRGTASRGFRAPGPAENGTAGHTYSLGNQSDPVLCKIDGNGNQEVGSFPGQCAVLAAIVQTTNPHLKAQTSTSGP